MTKIEFENLLTTSKKWYSFFLQTENKYIWVNHPTNFYTTLDLKEEYVEVYFECPNSMYNNVKFTVPYTNLKTVIHSFFSTNELFIVSFDFPISLTLNLGNDFPECQEKTA